MQLAGMDKDKKVLFLMKHLDRQIGLMDYCIEQLFNKKEGAFLQAYHKHVGEIQKDLEQLMGQGLMSDQFLEKKAAKVQQLEIKLS